MSGRFNCRAAAVIALRLSLDHAFVSGEDKCLYVYLMLVS